MNLDPLLLSRIQFAVTASFHIIFPAITIGLSIWLAVLQGLLLFTGNAIYQRLFDFWLKIFAILFAMGVVSGVVMAFQFGMNWSVMSLKSGSVMGPLLGYETFTAFLLEATFLGLVLYTRNHVRQGFYFFSCCMVAVGATLSSFWILCNNSWMQVPLGYELINGKIIPVDWRSIVLGPVFLNRWMHMLVSTFLTTAMCVLAVGASYVLRGRHLSESRFMMRWSLVTVAILMPLQFYLGDISGKYMYRYQPAKFAAIEARWHHEQPGTEVWFALPDEKNQRNLFSIHTPSVGSWIATGNWTAPVSGLNDFPRKDWPPILVPFFSFRIMVGLGLLILGMGWLGLWLSWRRRLEETRWFLWSAVLAFPSGLLAVIVGWFTAEVGRQPWVVYGLLRTSETVTPSLTGQNVLTTLIVYMLVYSLILFFGCYYVYRIFRMGPTGEEVGNPAVSRLSGVH
jgi:cytochrome d ubiquinol oxidase subunit I